VPITSHSIASYDAQPVLEQFVAGKKIQILISRIFPNFMENYKLLNFGYFSITFKRITFKMNFGFICICAYYGGGGWGDSPSISVRVWVWPSSLRKGTIGFRGDFTNNTPICPLSIWKISPSPQHGPNLMYDNTILGYYDSFLQTHFSVKLKIIWYQLLFPQDKKLWLFMWQEQWNLPMTINPNRFNRIFC